jgi:predicted aspartyl protease
MLSAIAVSACCTLFSAAAQTDCKPLGLITSVNLVPAQNKRADFIPVEINGVAKLMLLDTGAVYSSLSNAAVDELHLDRQNGNFEMYNVQGQSTNQFVVAVLTIGRLKAKVAFPVWPGKFNGDPAAGMIGADILSHYDISVDFGSDKLDLLSQDHCEGKVVYWPADTVAVLPIDLLYSGHIVIPVTLDGEHMTAFLDTGASSSTLTIPGARRYFDFKLGSADAPQRGNLTGDPEDTIYHRVFKTLDLNGILVSNLDVDIIPDKVGHKIENIPETGTRLTDPRKDENKPVMLIGMDVLRHLHIYIAYNEKKLYVTPATAPVAAPSH